jgi:hypothetical protein
MSLWLTEDELIELTGYKRQSLQIKALASMGVKFRSREKDGFPLVERAQFEHLTLSARRREPRMHLVQ